MRFCLNRVFEFGGLLAIALATLATAQQPAAPHQPPPDSGVTTLTVSSRLTLVDVTVTDSKGRPVHGLTKSDFTIKEDGKPQPLRNFEEFGTGRPTTEPMPPLPSNVYTNQPASLPTTQAVNILLFDQVATGIANGLQPHPEALKFAKEASSKYLKTMPAGTQMAILELDGDGLHIVQGFTSDQEFLLAAVNSIPFRLVAQSYWEIPRSWDFPPPPKTEPPLCNAMNFQSEQALSALNQTAAFASSIPGRKNLIWFTLGISWLMNYQPFSSIELIGCLRDYTPQLQQAYGRLTAARVAAYPMDPRGLLLDPVFSGAAGSPSGGDSRNGSSRPPPRLGEISQFKVSAFLDTGSLEDVAKATGGKAHFGNDLDGALRNATGADSYALSYVPPLSKYDGKYHTIEVKVDRPGLQLEYRRGYTSLDLAGPLSLSKKDGGKNAQPADPFHAAMDYGEPAATQLVFAVRAMPSTGSRKPEDPPVIGSLNPELKDKQLVRYSFDFDLPRDKITLVEQPDGTRKGSFELVIAAYDVQGRRLNSLDEKRSFILKPEMIAGFLQKPFVVPVLLDLPKGKLLVRAGVRDLPSDKIGAFEIPLSVDAP